MTGTQSRTEGIVQVEERGYDQTSADLTSAAAFSLQAEQLFHHRMRPAGQKTPLLLIKKHIFNIFHYVKECSSRKCKSLTEK